VKAIVKRMIQTSVAVGGSIALLMSIAPAASAAAARARDGHCDDGEFCLYHGLDYSGSVSDFSGSIPNYGDSQPGCYEYKGAGTGQGECAKNNAKSARSLTHIYVVKVYYNSNYKGRDFAFNPGGQGNLDFLGEQNASQLYELVS
jgi:hypothetical protein